MADIDVVCPTAAKESNQRTVVQHCDIHMNTAETLRHLDIAPGVTTVSGNFHCADIIIADPFFAGLGTAIKDGQQPVAVIKHRDWLSNERTGFIKQGGNLAPGLSEVV
ncbi:hypothetical protein ExPCM15_01960 [Escherichia coli]|nr:hypothetical protein ExPCM15_01960 [Escherichia coli]